MKTKISILIVLIAAKSILAQTSSIIDSLKLELDKKQEDTIKAQVLNDLAYYYLYQNIDTSLIYGKRAEKLATQIKYTKIKAKANLYIGNAFLYTNRYDSAKYYFENSFQIFDSEGLDKSAVYSSLGMLCKNQGDYIKAIEIYLEGIVYDEKNKNEYGKFIKLLNLANVYMILDEYQKSIDHQIEAVAISKSTNNENIKFALGTILNNIGGNYVQLSKFKLASDYFNESLIVNLKNENKKEIARNYNNLGVVSEKQNQLNKSLILLKKALVIREELEDKDELVETHMQLGVTYGKLLQKNISQSHFNIALELAKNINDLSLISEVYLALSDTYLLQNSPQQALANFKSHTQYKDSILQVDHLKSISELEIKYKTKKKDNEILTQQLELEQSAKGLQKKKTQFNYLIGISTFLLLISFLSWLVFKQRQKRKNQEIFTLKREFKIKTLETLIQGEEKERLRIAKELHDGVNGDLSAIKYKLSSILETNDKVIKEVVSMIDESCMHVRAISHNLIPPSLEKLNIIEATYEYCQNMDEIHPQNINFQHIGDPIQIPKSVEINIFRIIQELVTNSLNHAQANEIHVQMSCRRNSIHLTVEDNGKGFDTDQVKTNSGIGLENVKSRIECLHATMDLISNNQGTSYTIEIDTDKFDDN
ncbi:tetratricopeptide repeat-containing sensor histidine kinase [Aquimarina megaterium]|uniref:tetratricopeptide repeat-containing sensor histidine kinase n=1 Tax=Aquimarina megaterium TaxID=1443666 RepID=UPI000942AC72|nr:sensor histidine kinase [Aquimarina megaterium]